MAIGLKCLRYLTELSVQVTVLSVGIVVRLKDLDTFE